MERARNDDVRNPIAVVLVGDYGSKKELDRLAYKSRCQDVAAAILSLRNTEDRKFAAKERLYSFTETPALGGHSATEPGHTEAPLLHR